MTFQPDASSVAASTENAGFGGLWVLEAHTEPFLPLALAAEHTEHITLGTAVAVAVALARNPMVVAHLAHELNRFARGRLRLGLGAQVGAHVAARFGAPADQPVQRMTEFVRARMSRAGDWDAMAGLVSDEMLSEFSVEAPIGSLPAALRQRFDGLLDRVLVYAPYGVPAGLWREASL